jgi:type I restriction enzyme M protein
MADHHQLSNFIWQIADLLRGPYRQPQYERVMLPLVVLRRFDCVLKDTKSTVLARHDQIKDRLRMKLSGAQKQLRVMHTQNQL